MKQLEYCSGYKIICPYLHQENKELECLSDEKNCEKWRKIYIELREKGVKWNGKKV